jgi:hypothetical protein
MTCGKNIGRLQNYKATSLPESSANVSPGIQAILMKLKAIMSRKNFTSRYPWKTSERLRNQAILSYYEVKSNVHLTSTK